MKTSRLSNPRTLFMGLAAAGLVVSLAGCGGGGGSTSQMQITGTSATGKALAGAAITASCVAGSGRTSSDTGGKYSLDITDATGPCVVTATLGSTTLRSITLGGGVTNITPLTQLLVSYLMGRIGAVDPAQLVAAANANTISLQTLDQGKAAVAAIVKKYGVTISADDFLSGNLVPGNSDADTDLEHLKEANVLDGNGEPTKQVTDDCTNEGGSNPPPTGATGATGAV